MHHNSENNENNRRQPPVQPPTPTTFSFATMTRKEMIMGICGILFVVFMMRNILFKDYNNETKSYLTSIGRKDAIDKVVPKTYKQILNEKVQKDLLIESLDKNVTMLLKEYKSLRSEVDFLKSKHEEKSELVNT
jgi:hypothetical protein